MTITICGSMAFAKEMKEVKSQLEKLGFEAIIPVEAANFNYQDYTSLQGANLKIENNFINEHCNKIRQSTGILVLNYDKKSIKNYIGGNTLIEMGFAFTANKDIFMLNASPDLSYQAEIDGMQPIVLNGDLNLITKYYENLPKIYLASESEIKKSAVDFGFRELKKKYQVCGLKTNSDVSEEPLSFEETYTGAFNRLNHLKKQVTNQDYDYIISIESGTVRLLNDFNYFDISICLTENKEGVRHISITGSIEYPKKMTDEVPSKYPDLGVLVQQKYGLKRKDPIAYLTNNKVTREKLLQQAVVNTLAQFK